LKKYVVGSLKVLVPLAIIVWLCQHAWRQHPEAVETLREGQTNVGLLLAAYLTVLVAHLIGIFRWHLLLTALQIPIRPFDTLRLGFLGHLFNLISPGHVGGDLFKAVFVARQQTARRAAAVATIIVDRACGLYGLLIVTTIALLTSDISTISPQVAVVAKGAYFLTAAGAIVIGMVVTPPLANSRAARRLTEVPRIGRLFARLLAAVLLYQRRWPVLVAVGLMSVVIHALLAVALFLVARGVYLDPLPLYQHFVISPLSNVAGSLPITPGGLGTFELALSYLYDLFSPPGAQGRGILIALLMRLTIILVAGIGIFFYWQRHGEVQQLLRQAEQEVEQHAEQQSRHEASAASSR
jgi:hypothetical protein